LHLCVFSKSLPVTEFGDAGEFVSESERYTQLGMKVAKGQNCTLPTEGLGRVLLRPFRVFTWKWLQNIHELYYYGY
jgi:hypothetical protein